MTNRERISRMNSKEMAGYLKKIYGNDLFRFYDIEKWLDSESEDAVYTGKDGWYLMGNSELERRIAENEGRTPVIKRVPCRIVGNGSIYGMPYTKVIVNGRFISTPKENVEEA